MSLVRKPDWAGALDAFLRANRDRKFRYGSWDCCLFVANAVQAMTGVDLAVAFRSRYGSRSGALRAAKEYCGKARIGTLVARVTGDYGMPEVEARMAQRGDLVMLPRAGGDHSLGIVALNGRDVVIAMAEGLWRTPLSGAVKAWRV